MVLVDGNSHFLDRKEKKRKPEKFKGNCDVCVRPGGECVS